MAIRIQATWASALTYQMIYEQPVLYEFKNIIAPTLLIVARPTAPLSVKIYYQKIQPLDMAITRP